MDLRRPLTDQELLHLIQQGLSDTQGFSNDNGETDEDSHIKEGNLVYLRFHQLTWDYPSKNTTNSLRMKKMYIFEIDENVDDEGQKSEVSNKTEGTE
jgi:hypothetical protein